jgi:hypothetical protein
LRWSAERIDRPRTHVPRRLVAPTGRQRPPSRPTGHDVSVSLRMRQRAGDNRDGSSAEHTKQDGQRQPAERGRHRWEELRKIHGCGPPEPEAARPAARAAGSGQCRAVCRVGRRSNRSHSVAPDRPRVCVWWVSIVWSPGRGSIREQRWPPRRRDNFHRGASRRRADARAQ